MIARMWHGIVPSEKAQDYHQYLLKTGLKDYSDIAGNEGVFLLKQTEGDVTHYYTLTFWKNIESIKLFAGDDHEKARYYPEDRDFLVKFEEKVSHFEVLESSFKPDIVL